MAAGETPTLQVRESLLVFYVILPTFDASEVGMPAGGMRATERESAGHSLT